MFDNQNKRLIAETIFDNPDEEFSLRGLAGEIDLSPSTVSRLIEDLEEKGIVKVERGLKMEIKAAKTEAFRDYKRTYNFLRLIETGLIDELEENTLPEAIVLFGNYSRGEDSSGSDIDIAVVNGREPGLEIGGYERELDRKLNIQKVDLEKADENFIETLANGVVMRGYLDI